MDYDTAYSPVLAEAYQVTWQFKTNCMQAKKFDEL